MMEHLWDIWQDYMRLRRGPAGTWQEIRIWMEQNCVYADDFAYNIACCMRDAVAPLA